MLDYFNKANRAQRRAMAARLEIITSEAFAPGEPGKRPADQLGRYVIQPHQLVDDMELSWDDCAIYYNVDWILRTSQDDIILKIRSIFP